MMGLLRQRSRFYITPQMAQTVLFLGVDGGGTSCRARLADAHGIVRAEASAGPANIRIGLKESFGAVLEVAEKCLSQAGYRPEDADIIACLAMAGASEPTDLAAARDYDHPFLHIIITTDAHAACIGAHGARDGGVIIVGTGSVGWALIDGTVHRVGGWGFPVSDEGSGAWLGCEAARRVLWAYDGRIPWTGLLQKLYARFERDPHRIVRWMGAALPRDFGSLAPLVIDYAAHDDPTARALLRIAAGHIDLIAQRLAYLGVSRLTLAGGLAPSIEPWLAPATRKLLVPAEGDALSGALSLARRELTAAQLRRA
jgi:glucosamine kinase